MANKYATLSELFTAIANAIRSKNGSTQDIIADNFPTEISNLRTGFDYNNQNATTISDYEFRNCTDLKSVDCYGLTSIGTSAFENCKNLKSVILYDGVINVGENVFKGCSDDLIIYYKGSSVPETWDENWNPDNYPVIYGELIETWDISATEEDNVIAELCAIGDKYNLYIYGNGDMKDFSWNGSPWYSYRNNIKSVVICEGVANIGSYCLYGCDSVDSITISNSVTHIGSISIGSSSLTSITIPDSVTSIDNGAFNGCTSLTSIIVHENNTTYQSIDGCLYNKSGSILLVVPKAITSVNIPNEVSDIGDAFNGCKFLTSITIPDSVTSIGNRAFYGCKSLTSINIPDSVTSIGNYVFVYCTSLTSINIPNSVTNIGNWAFNGCTSLTSIIIPDSVTSIGNRVLYGCTSLTSITISDSVTSIDYEAFSYCSGLTSVTIPDSVTSIGSDAFYGCSNLQSVTIGDSVTSIGDYAFGGCNRLTSITYTGTIIQWQAITFDSDWNTYTGNYTIHCTDGDIAKDGTITYHTISEGGNE